VEAKPSSQRSVIRWVTNIYHFELLRASEGTLSCWSRLRLQSLTTAPVLRRVDVRRDETDDENVTGMYVCYVSPRRVDAGRWLAVKITAKSLLQHDDNMLYRPLLVG
jgi:hypothetical protein